MTGDGGRWLRKQCLIMARNNNTPITYFLSCTFRELSAWVQTNNEIVRESKHS